MSVPYDVFTEAFLGKVIEYDFINLPYDDRTAIIDGYMKRAVSQFRKICKYDISSTLDDSSREFDVTILEEDIYEIADIVSEGMLVQWMKPYLYHQSNLELVINTKDFSTYSPAELLKRIGDAHAQVQKNFTNMMREYSFVHGDLTELHL